MVKTALVLVGLLSLGCGDKPSPEPSAQEPIGQPGSPRLETAGQVERLFGALITADPGDQRTVIDQIVALGDAAAPSVVRRLESEDERVRRAAYEIIERLGGACLPALAEACADPDWEIRVSATAALRTLGKGAIPIAVTVLSEDKMSEIRGVAAGVLGEIGCENLSATTALLLALEDADYDVCVEAGRSLLKVKPALDSTIPALVRLLDHESDDAAHRAAYVLPRLGPRGVAALAQAVHSTDVDVRRLAVDSLSYYGEPPEAVPALADALSDPDLSVRESAAMALAVYDSELLAVIPALRSALEDESLVVRRCAIRALGNSGYEGSAVEMDLERLLDDPTESIRVRAARTLYWMGKDHPSFVEILTRALSNPDPKLRQEAAEGLRDMRLAARRSLPSLLHALRDPVPGVRAAAAAALGTVVPGSKKTASALEPLLDDRSTRVRQGAVKVLGRIGAAGIQCLIRALDDAEASVRREAARALADLRVPAPGAHRRLLLVMDTDSPLVGTEAARAVWMACGDKERALQYLTGHLADLQGLIRDRSWAALSIGRIGAKAAAAKESLLSVVEERLGATSSGIGPCLLVESAFGLWRVSGVAQPAVSALLGVLDDSECNEWWRKRILEALTEIGPSARAAIPSLERLRVDPDITVRLLAQDCLNSINKE
jgi:HEAT repeat protein